ncbi:MAG: hypothetical protein OEO19_01740 [Gammaproteobacteria bacterium]|nr:hypothetical protein [Gammaproteobacteria bacterium]MDH3448569.1 hypothetical protein [Gammaproteobacteria bacterium]
MVVLPMIDQPSVMLGGIRHAERPPVPVTTPENPSVGTASAPLTTIDSD